MDPDGSRWILMDPIGPLWKDGFQLILTDPDRSRWFQIDQDGTEMIQVEPIKRN